jgi:RNA recognition motif-containing protein
MKMLINGVLIAGKPCGDCFVEFKKEKDAELALTKNNEKILQNDVQIMLIPREQVQAVLNSFNGSNGDDNSRSSSSMNQGKQQNRDWALPSDFGENGFVVMISNLSYRADIEDILDEFRDFDLKPDQIIRRYNDNGQPTGYAAISFNSEEDAVKACDEYNRVQILNRPIWLRRA